MRSFINLLDETMDALTRNGHTTGEVIWVGGETYGWFTWEDFTELANRCYDNGYGAQMVAMDLVVVGADWWLQRAEESGSEWWEYLTCPAHPETYQKPSTLFPGRWENLGEDVWSSS